MGRILGFMRRYPIVAATIAVLALVLGLIAAGLEPQARWAATGYVGVVVAWTAVGMLRDILKGRWGLDILAVVAMIASLAVGEYLAALIIVLMLSGGEALEDYAAGRATAELDALLARAPQLAHRLAARAGADPAAVDDAAVEDLSADDVRPGDVLLVRPAELVPVDGVLLDPEAAFDESSLTGESLPVQRAAGEDVLAGAVNGVRAVRIRAAAAAADSQYQRIIALVRDAEQAKAPTVRVADRFALPFTAVSLAIAGIAWWLSGDPVRFAEVLVLATPCPLLIAAPVAFMAGMSRAAKEGVIVKGGATLEALARAKSAAFDKTGTLTQGEPRLVRSEPAPGAGIDEGELLRLAASAEQYSSHVLAAGVIEAARERGLELSPGQAAEEHATNGVDAVVHGRRIRVGKLAYIRELDPEAAATPLGPGETAVFVAVDGLAAGSLVLADELRTNSAATVAGLREDGIGEIAMLTGDNEQTAAHLAKAAGIGTVHAALLPADKVELVQAMPARPVIMVGDGVNDAPVLAAAEVGIAMGARGSTAASESADVVILADDIGKVGRAVSIGRRTYSVALGAIWTGILLSLALMLVASIGLIPAVVGALTQELVDLAAILSALRALGGARGAEPALAPERRAQRPSTMRGVSSAGSSRSASGRACDGKPWKATGRRNRSIAAVPTEVEPLAVEAGYGPPCCCA